MARSRPALAVILVVLAMAGTACRFSRTNNAALPTSTSSASTIDIFEETSTSIDDASTTTVASSSTTARQVTTTRRPTVTTTKPAPKPAPTAAPSVPHCNVSTADTFYGSSWTASVTSTFPGTNVVIALSWPGSSGNYSGVTDGSGSFQKTQRVQPSMRGQTVQVHVTVGGKSCSSSFKVS